MGSSLSRRGSKCRKGCQRTQWGVFLLCFPRHIGICTELPLFLKRLMCAIGVDLRRLYSEECLMLSPSCESMGIYLVSVPSCNTRPCTQEWLTSLVEKSKAAGAKGARSKGPKGGKWTKEEVKTITWSWLQNNVLCDISCSTLLVLGSSQEASGVACFLFLRAKGFFLVHSKGRTQQNNAISPLWAATKTPDSLD